MIQLEVVVRDERGDPLDLSAISIDRLVELIGTDPAGEENDPDRRVWGTARLTLEAVEAASRQVAAIRAACVVAVGESTPDDAARDRAADEVACSLVVSGRSARITVDASQTVCSQPPVWAALARGEIDLTRARILADALMSIPRWDADGVERPTFRSEQQTLFEEGLPYATENTARRLALFLQRRLKSIGCGDLDRRRRRALAQRGVWIAHDGDGTADLTARLSSEDAERIYAAIRACALADRNGDPSQAGDRAREPFDLWMAAAFVDLVLGKGGLGSGLLGSSALGSGALSSSALGSSAPGEGAGPAAVSAPARADGRRPVSVNTVINVTIPVDSLAGLCDEPGVLNGFGVIPAETARRLAAGDTRWRHILTCRTSGAVLDVGTLSYRPPAALDRHVRLRDGTCRFPGCSVPAYECDLDHLIPFPQGPTSAENLHSLCRRHHGLKHEGDWRVEAVGNDGLRWTSPQGATATSYPDDTLRCPAA